MPQDKHTKMIKPRRFFTHCNKVYWTYKWTYDQWENSYDDNKKWHGYDEWMVAIGFDNKFYRNESWYYDGHTAREFTILGITFVKVFSYQAERMTDE